MKLYFAKHADGAITTANWPIKETGADSFEFEVDEEVKKLVDEGEKDFQIENGELKVVDSTRKAEREAELAKRQTELEVLQKEKAELKIKLEKKEASLDEIQTLLAKLL